MIYRAYALKTRRSTNATIEYSVERHDVRVFLFFVVYVGFSFFFPTFHTARVPTKSLETHCRKRTFCEILCNSFVVSQETGGITLQCTVIVIFHVRFLVSNHPAYSLSDILALTSSSLTTLLGLNWLPVDSSCRLATSVSFVSQTHQCCA